MNINSQHFNSKNNKESRLYKYVNYRLNNEMYTPFTDPNFPYELASSLVKFANNGYTMSEWIENIDDYLEELVDYKLFTDEDNKKNSSSIKDQDILLTLTLLQMYENGEGIKEEDFLEKWNMLQTSFTLESLRRKGACYRTKDAKKFKLLPNSEYQVSPYATYSEDEENAIVKFKPISISKMTDPILINRNPSENDINHPIGSVWINQIEDECFILDEIVHYSFDECPKAKWSILHASKWAKNKIELQ